MSGWGLADMPDQGGRTAIVTGGNSGLGAETVRALAAKGARVLLACRDRAKGDAVAAAMHGDVEVRELDLASLESVRAFAAGVDEPLDLLINNAGVMAPPRGKTADGFETQIGTNHLGHFALTGLLLERVRDRVVTLSSNAHRLGRIRFDDLQSERRYGPWTAYNQSKLANLLFVLELQRRLAAAGSSLRSMGAHPGYADTNLQFAGPAMAQNAVGGGATRFANRFLAQSAAAGALPTLYAATMPDLPGGSYVGPSGPGQFRGAPKVVRPRANARDLEVAARLWTVSEQLTGVTFPLADAAAA
ncbi:MAG TPA: oxidoreductase [Conexibacter sp.]|nr:oxidoreductase [Conexibacter sp.]